MMNVFNLTTVIIFRNRTSFDIVVLQTGSINFNIYLKTKRRPERMEENSKDLILMNTFFANSFLKDAVFQINLARYKHSTFFPRP